MRAENTPWLECRLISLRDRAPAILATLVIDEPVATPIAIVLDLSDSCHDLSRLISFVQKTLKAFPPAWPLQVFRLSSPVRIGRSNLRLMDLIEAENVIDELCDTSGSILAAKDGGSFLRPVIESLNHQLESSGADSRVLALVLGDGQFTDFGTLDLHPRLSIAAITPTRFVGTPLNSDEPRRELIPSFAMHDAGLDALINPFRSPFYGSVTLEPIFRDDNGVAPENLFRVDEYGRVTPWCETDTHLFNLSGRDIPILVDAPMDAFQQMRWKVRSATTSATITIQGAIPGSTSNRSLDQGIAQHFAGGDAPLENELLFQADSHSSDWQSIAAAVETAIQLAKDSRPWINNDGTLTVFREGAMSVLGDPYGRPRCDAMMLVRCTHERATGPSEVLAFALERYRAVAFQCIAEQTLSGVIASRGVSIRFDSKAYRWFLTPESTPPIELDYYAAESLTNIFHQADHNVDVCFSGNLR